MRHAAARCRVRPPSPPAPPGGRRGWRRRREQRWRNQAKRLNATRHPPDGSQVERDIAIYDDIRISRITAPEDAIGGE
jgi:hypothetical protein